jgi:hypothetical protein
MDQELTVRPVLCWPPQPRSPTLADAEHGFHFGLVPVGYDHALIAEVLAIRKEDGLAQVAVLDLSFLLPIPLPLEVSDRPVVEVPRGREKVVESVVPDSLGDLTPDGAFLARLLTCHGSLDGGGQGMEFLLGLVLEQVQRAHLLTIETGAKAHQEFAVDPSQSCGGLGLPLDPPSIGQDQGLRRPQGPLEKRAHPARRNRRQEGKLGLVEGLKVVKRDLALVQNAGEAGGRLRWEPLAAHAAETGAQGDHIGPMALIAAIVERQAPLLIDDQSQRELPEIMTLLLSATPLGEAGTTVKGRDACVVVCRIIDQELLTQREALAYAGEPLALDEVKMVRFKEVHGGPEALAAQLLGSRGGQPAEHCFLGPCGEGALAFGPDGAVARRQGQGVAHREGGTPPRRGGRAMGVNQVDEPEVLRQIREQG